MDDSAFYEHAFQALTAFNAAIQNLHLYPDSRAVKIGAIQSAYQSIQKVFEHGGPLVFAVVDKKLQICEKILGESDQNTFLVQAFTDLLIQMGVSRITFTKGLEEAEFEALIDAASRKSGDLDRKGGLREIIAEKSIRHILVSFKVDEELAKSQKIFPESIERVDITETFAPMVQTLDNILEGESKEKVAYHLAASMATTDVEILSKLLPEHIESEFGERLFSNILQEMDDDTFEEMVSILKRHIDETRPGTEKIGDAKIEPFRQAYRKMMESDEGLSLKDRLKEKESLEKRNKEKQISNLKTGLNRILKGEIEVFRDQNLMASLPNAITQLFSKGTGKTAWSIINRLGKELLGTDKEIRGIVTETLLDTIDRFSSQRRLEAVERLSNELIGWIKLENASTPGYEKICIHLDSLAQNYLQNKNFSEYHRILKTIRAIQNGSPQKGKESQFDTSVTLNTITSNDILDLLLAEFLTNEEKKREQAIYSLVQMGPVCVPRLLDLLKETRDRSIRAKVVQIITDIGPSAIAPLAEKIREEGPWYYTRNLLLIFGKIGDESHLRFVHPLLTHEDHRVQREALNSIFAIGGEKREDILISLLSTADDRLKTDAVGMLGALKCRRAVPELLGILDSKSYLPSRARSDLEEKVCTVLGSLGTRESIPVLRSIIEPKRGLRMTKSWSEKVQLAADQAIAMIEGRIPS
jgi:hypothetical protein